MSSILDGQFTTASTVAPIYLSLPSGYTEFRMVNITDIGSTAANTNVMRASGYSLLPAGSAYRNLKTNGAATLALEDMILTNGFTFFDNGNPPVFAATAVTGVTAANPAVVTSAAHGLSQGDTVRLYGLNGTMQPMNGLLFTVNNVVGPNSFSITFDATGLVGGTPATAGFAQKVIPNYFSPHNIVVGPTATINSGNLLQLCLNTVPNLFTAGVGSPVSQGASQYIPFLPPYQIGAKLRFYLPTGFGTSAASANGLLLQITGYAAAQAGYNYQNIVQCQILPGGPVGSVTTANGLAAINYPAGAASYRGQVPLITDIAEVVQDLSEAEDNTGIRGIIIGTSVQTASKQYQWFARKGYTIS